MKGNAYYLLAFIIIFIIYCLSSSKIQRVIEDQAVYIQINERNVKHKRESYVSGSIKLEFLEFVKTVDRSTKFAKEYCKYFFYPKIKRIKKIRKDIHNCNYKKECYNEDFSYFTYSIQGRVYYEYIEPLFGFFREYDFGCTKSLSLDRYLIVGYNDSNVDTVYFDLGATTFKCLAQQFFYKYYKMKNFRFTNWYLWEVKKFSEKEIYGSLPKDLEPIYHYSNAPVPVDIKNAGHPFNIILNNNYNKTYVTMKLDIDTPELELTIFNELLEGNKYNDILDELFFEYHFELKDFKWWYKVSIIYH